jgi:hypothetical protein
MFKFFRNQSIKKTIVDTIAIKKIINIKQINNKLIARRRNYPIFYIIP